MTSRLAGGFGNWPLSAKVIAALTCALLPLGVLATIVTANTFRQVAAANGTISAQGWASVALPLLMWLSALLIGWLIANRLLVNPLVRMRAAVERYGAGDTSVRLGKFDFLSQEMDALAQAFDRMADDIGRHDVEMRDALAEQKRLTREVHHRVKNNLQIVSSLLSLQARETSSPEVARAYSTVQSRVGALALVHRWMYDDESARGVDLRALATDLCAGLEQGIQATEGVTARLHCTVERFFVGQDTAVPVAFLITEIVSLAARRAAPGALEATITAKAEGALATITICAAPFVDAPIEGSGDPSVRIIQGMARQLRSPLRHDPADGSYSIAIGVPVIPGDAGRG